MEALQLRAGFRALAQIRKHGLSPDLVRVVSGASGGPKWLILSEFDRHFFGDWLARARQPITLIGSSIGAWRMMLHAQPDPVAALDRFLHSYVHEQRYSRRPTPREISGEIRRLLDVGLGDGGARAVVSNAARPLQIITNRIAGNGHHGQVGVFLRMLAAAGANLRNRQALGRWMIRSLFETPSARASLPDPADFPTERHELHANNLREVLSASGSIPGWMEPVRDIAGAPPGTYLDGGISDYHPAFSHETGEGIVAMPHFYGHLIPGWLDKRLRARHNRLPGLENTLVIAPSKALVADLPHGKIPDRHDFIRFKDQARIDYWEKVRQASRRMGEEFMELVETNRLLDRIQSFD